MMVVGATMGQVCFAAISSNRACHHGLHCFQFSVPDLCVCFPSVQGLGSGARSLPPFSTVPGQLPPVRLCARQTVGQAYARVPGRLARWAVPLQGEGRVCRSGVISGRALAVVGPILPATGGGGGGGGVWVLQYAHLKNCFSFGLSQSVRLQPSKLVLGDGHPMCQIQRIPEKPGAPRHRPMAHTSPPPQPQPHGQPSQNPRGSPQTPEGTVTK